MKVKQSPKNDYEMICPCCGLRNLQKNATSCPQCKAKLNGDPWFNIASFVSPFMSGMMGYLEFSGAQRSRRA